MKIAIIDADIIGRKKHRFPNLACEKIAGYWKDQGAEVQLVTTWPTAIEMTQPWWDELYVSKVFTDTAVPDYLDVEEHVHLGGTGFFFDRAKDLPEEIEHHMPDYHLYDSWIEVKVQHAAEAYADFNELKFRKQFKEYTDYSIGFLTRGCFRHCPFCVNQKYDKVVKHSPLEEFYDPSRKKLCFLDDNFFGCPDWHELLTQVMETKVPFKFKQGLDERLLSVEKIELLKEARYDGYITFAFDDSKDYDIIESKLKLIREEGLAI